MPTDTFSITADADDASGGFVQSGAAWPPTGVGFFNDQGNATCFVGKDGSFNKVMEDGFLRFDTSSLPADAVISAANLLLHFVTVTNGDGTFGLVADYFDFGGGAVVSGDIIETSSPSILVTTALSSLTAGSVNSVGISDLTGISLSGITPFRLTLSAGTPTTGNKADFAAREHATAPAAQLEVTYTTPPVDPPTAVVAWMGA